MSRWATVRWTTYNRPGSKSTAAALRGRGCATGLAILTVGRRRPRPASPSLSPDPPHHAAWGNKSTKALHYTPRVHNTGTKAGLRHNIGGARRQGKIVVGDTRPHACHPRLRAPPPILFRLSCPSRLFPPAITYANHASHYSRSFLVCCGHPWPPRGAEGAPSSPSSRGGCRRCLLTLGKASRRPGPRPAASPPPPPTPRYFNSGFTYLKTILRPSL